MSHITLIRHGQANSGAQDEAGYDALSELGARQAAWLGDYWEQTRERFDALQEERQSGRNRLLELNACRHERAEEVIAAIETLDNDKALPGYLERAFDIFGIESRDLGDGITYLAPGPHMLDGLPGLVKGEEGFSVTSDRATALSREDVQHLSWEHPLVREMLVRILDGSMGNTALALLKQPPSRTKPSRSPRLRWRRQRLRPLAMSSSGRGSRSTRRSARHVISQAVPDSLGNTHPWLAIPRSKTGTMCAM